MGMTNGIQRHEIKLVEVNDAEFIIKLRNDPELKKHLNFTSASLEDQKEWIRAYKKREAKGEEYYFVIYENGAKVGLYRLYEINSISFTIGSWLFSKCQYKSLPIISDLAITNLGFENFKLPIMRFDVRKDNLRVLRYSAVKKPILFTEDVDRFYYILPAEQWKEAQDNILKFFRIDRYYYQDFKNELISSFAKMLKE